MNQYYTVMFSGGIDSTYCLYKLLNEGFNVHAHFINLHQSSIRYVMEQKAVISIIGWFNNNGYNIHFTQSIIKFNKRIPNIAVLGYVGIHVYLDHYDFISKTEKNFKLDLVYGSEKDTYGFSREDKKVQQIIFNSYFDYRKGRKPKLFSPILDVWKADMFKELPGDLIELTWTCRNPKKSGSRYIQCGECRPCKRNIRQKKGENFAIQPTYRKF